MAFAPVERLTPSTYAAMQFNGTKAAGMEMVEALDWGLANGLIIDCYVKGFREGENPPEWRVVLVEDALTPESVANAGMWIVLVTTGTSGDIEVLDDAAYRVKYSLPA